MQQQRTMRTKSSAGPEAGRGNRTFHPQGAQGPERRQWRELCDHPDEGQLAILHAHAVGEAHDGANTVKLLTLHHEREGAHNPQVCMGLPMRAGSAKATAGSAATPAVDPAGASQTTTGLLLLILLNLEAVDHTPGHRVPPFCRCRSRYGARPKTCREVRGVCGSSPPPGDLRHRRDQDLDNAPRWGLLLQLDQRSEQQARHGRRHPLVLRIRYPHSRGGCGGGGERSNAADIVRRNLLGSSHATEGQADWQQQRSEP
mmetsp:Transcript_115368/g.366901  ORF Transcript_115368/g.366901 Transcript_115368/m.366901 type:complete len:258 (+) Transcript_115368:521-1294(+)